MVSQIYLIQECPKILQNNYLGIVKKNAIPFPGIFLIWVVQNADSPPGEGGILVVVVGQAGRLDPEVLMITDDWKITMKVII